MDFFTKFMSSIIIPNAENEIVQYKTVANIELDTTDQPTDFQIAGHTFYHDRRYLLDAAMFLASLFPFNDHNVRSEPLVLIKDFKQRYASILRHTDLILYQGLSDVTDPSKDTTDLTDDFLVLLIKQGIGSMLIEPSIYQGVYKIDLNEMSMFEVRTGFIRYGGCLKFDTDYELLSIDYNNKIYHPTDTLWPQMKYIFVSSLIVNATIKYHAGYLHLVYGSRVPYMLNFLPEDHYLFQLMKPFTYKNTPSAELARTILYGKHRYFHRLFAFTHQGLEDFNQYIFDHFQHTRFPEHKASIDPRLVSTSPYFIDGSDLWQSIEKFVREYISRHFNPTDKDLGAVLRNWDRITENMYPIQNSVDSLTDFFTHYIFISTSIHELIGNNIIKHVYNPRIMSAKLRWSDNIREMYPDVQTYQQTMLIAVGTSLMILPKLIDDFSTVFTRPEDRELIQKFRTNLVDLSNAIDLRNKSREIPYFGAHPEYLEVSMSV